MSRGIPVNRDKDGGKKQYIFSQGGGSIGGVSTISGITDYDSISDRNIPYYDGINETIVDSIIQQDAEDTLLITSPGTLNEYVMEIVNIGDGTSGIGLGYNGSGSISLFGTSGGRTNSIFTNVGGHEQNINGSSRLIAGDGAFRYSTNATAAGASDSVMRLRAGASQKILTGRQSDDTEVFAVDYDGTVHGTDAVDADEFVTKSQMESSIVALGSDTLANVSTLSDDATKSLYTMTAGVPVEFRDSAGSPLLYLDETNGRIGVGTNNPTALLDMYSTVNAEKYLKFGTGGGYFEFADGGGGSAFVGAIRVFGDSNNSNFFIGDSNTDTGTNALVRFSGRINNGTVNTRPIFDVANLNTPLMSMLPDGKLGIGTTSPDGQLDVSSAGDTDFYINTTGTGLTALNFKSTGIGTRIWRNEFNRGQTLALTWQFIESGTATTQMTLSRYGDLSIQGAISFDGNLSMGKNLMLGTGSAYIKLYDGLSGQMHFSTATNASNNARKFKWYIAGTDQVMLLDYQGHLGIGDTLTPTARLHVRGDGATSATETFRLEDSTGDLLSRVLDDSTFEIHSTHASPSDTAFALYDSTNVMRFGITAAGDITSGGVAVPTISSTDTLTNKTIDGDNNTITNLDIGNEVDWAAAADVADASAFASGDKLLIFEAGVGLRKIDYDDLPNGGGGASQLSDLSDVVSATNTNRYVLVANGTTGYVGRALVHADISDLSSYTGFDARYYTESETDSLLLGKADTSHAHTLSDITNAGTVAGLDTGTGAGNVPVLDGNGKLNTSVIPSLAVSEYLGNFTDTTAALADAGVQASERGDWFTVNTSGGLTYIVTTDSPTTTGHITQMSTPTSDVQSVNGNTGVVVLDPDDLDDTSTSHKFVTATQKTNWDTAYGRGDHAGLYSLLGHTHTASDITDFDTEVSNNTDVAANTSARHDAVTVLDSAEIDFTLTGQQITASIVAGSIDETKLDASVNASLDLADSALQSSDIGTTVQGYDADTTKNDVTNTFTADQTFNTTITANQDAVFDAEVDDGNSGTADTIDWTTGNVHKSTMTGDCTYTFTAPAGPCHLTLKLVQDGTGSRTATRPATVKRTGGTAPTLTTAASAIDIVTFYRDGTNYFGVASLNFS